MRLSIQDQQEFSQYIKYFTLKFTQIVIESRSGQKIATQSKLPGPGADNVFNLTVPDLPDVVAATKAALNDEHLTPQTPLRVEISLRTPEGDRMIVEYWCLRLLTEPADPAGIKQAVCTRLGILLKSLVAITRTTPGFKLSRRQGPDSYVICYRIEAAEPNLHSLGDGYKQVSVGQVCTPSGTLQLYVVFRTKMTISPTQAERNPIMVKSDHFNANATNRRLKNNDEISDLTKPLKSIAFAETNSNLPTESIIPVEPEMPDVTRLLSMGKYKTRLTNKSESESESLCGDVTKIVAENEKVSEENKENSPRTSSISMTSTLKSQEEEYWIKEVQAPFAAAASDDLMQFLKQCKRSPPLHSPQKGLTQEEVTEILTQSESQLPVYEDLLRSISESSDDN